MNHLAAFILFAALVVLAAMVWAENRADPAPIVNAAWSQPSSRLFTVCPLDQRNAPVATERSA